MSAKIKAKLPGGGGEGLSYAEIKKFGVSGTVAYILTELAFWAIAFPVASFTLYNTAGHWPDLSDGGDRTADPLHRRRRRPKRRRRVPLRARARAHMVKVGRRALVVVLEGHDRGP